MIKFNLTVNDGIKFNENELTLKDTNEIAIKVSNKIIDILKEKNHPLYFNIDYKKISFNLIFVTKEEIRKINKSIIDVDRETDVISLPMQEYNFETDGFELGDVLICYDIMLKQANELNHSLQREFGFLLCHALLHLHNFDHQTIAEEKEMFQLQHEILEAIKLYR